MTKKEKETMLNEKKDELKEILKNLSVEDAYYLIMKMKSAGVFSASLAPTIFPIEDFDVVLSSWCPSDVLRCVSPRFNINYSKYFFIDDYRFIGNEDEYIYNYYHVNDAYEFLEQNDFTEETEIQQINDWESEYHKLEEK